MNTQICSACGQSVTSYATERICVACYEEMYRRIIAASVRRPPTTSGLTFRLRGLKRRACR